VDAAAVIDIAMQTMLIAAKLAAPVLITSLVVGFAISVLQSITQVQEVTLSFVPKAVAVAIALLVCGQWMISEVVSFTHQMFAMVPQLLGGGS
jgi:flagellar biosynthesis protein FliQ